MKIDIIKSFILLQFFFHFVCGNFLQEDLCYHDDGSPRRCQPEFLNIASGREVTSSSSCGSPPSKHCYSTEQQSPKHQRAAYLSSKQFQFHRNFQQMKHLLQSDEPPKALTNTCLICNSSSTFPSFHFPTSHLTDLHNPNDPTCWMSAPFSKSPSDSPLSSHVTLTIPLGGTFELTYISLQFCWTRPDSLVIYKSMDHQVTWLPFQYYSSNCRKTYRKNPSHQASLSNEQEALCSEEYSIQNNTVSKDFSISFSTLEGRPSAGEMEKNAALLSWQSATDIRIIFNRLVPNVVAAPFREPLKNFKNFNYRKMRSSSLKRKFNHSSINRKNRRKLRSHGNFSNPSNQDPFSFYSLSDISIGGRCQCNGHASECEEVFINESEEQIKINKREKREIKRKNQRRIRKKNLQNKNRRRREEETEEQKKKLIKKKFICKCKHNTMGDNCELCRPFYVDQPWTRASPSKPNECKACNCNGHSKKCKFSLKLYKSTNSGGFCIDCLHNTDGVNCEKCKKDFFRDPNKPQTHPFTCLACNCHPIGSLSRSCDQLTGQCKCKEGITGKNCNRCGEGYIQTSSAEKPCLKISPDDQGIAGDQENKNKNFKNCHSCIKKFNFKNNTKICNKENVLIATILSIENFKDLTKYKIKINKIIKSKISLNKNININNNNIIWTIKNNNKKNNNFNDNFDNNNNINFNVLKEEKEEDEGEEACHCLDLKIGKTYLFLGNSKNYDKLRGMRRRFVTRGMRGKRRGERRIRGGRRGERRLKEQRIGEKRGSRAAGSQGFVFEKDFFAIKWNKKVADRFSRLMETEKNKSFCR